MLSFDRVYDMLIADSTTILDRCVMNEITWCHQLFYLKTSLQNDSNWSVVDDLVDQSRIKNASFVYKIDIGLKTGWTSN